MRGIIVTFSFFTKKRRESCWLAPASNDAHFFLVWNLYQSSIVSLQLDSVLSLKHVMNNIIWYNVIMTRSFHHSFTWLLVALTDLFCFVFCFSAFIWYLLTHFPRLALFTFYSKKWPASYFSSHYYWWITHWGHRNIGNDHQLNVKCIENSIKNKHIDVRVTSKG